MALVFNMYHQVTELNLLAFDWVGSMIPSGAKIFTGSPSVPSQISILLTLAFSTVQILGIVLQETNIGKEECGPLASVLLPRNNIW